ncbi:PAS domain-containing protein [Halobacillus salinarum]|uniref:PAS domain-containing protein n=1 Tax=Halobacillus salinarum TaxID=2932257 RepID=A0ABY4EQS5_9BACI|nr:PAS domain-containing protein [Halobacillus salinarum]UOQ44456.1 PAS domain-containing protein [Halobacillus salinarum]
MNHHTFNKLHDIKKNEFIKTAIDHVGAGVVISDPQQEDNPIIYMNEGFEQLTGYSSEEVLGKNCRFLQGEDSNTETIKKIHEALKNTEQVQVEIKNYRKDGSMFWNELQIFPVYLEHLEQTYFVGVQKDVTVRKEAERLVGHYSSEVKRLSTPIVPVEDHISILPLIGTVDEQRLQQMLDTVSHHVQQSKDEYLILDLSAISSYNGEIHRGSMR